MEKHYKYFGSLQYQYPLIQYKVIQGVPMLVALNKGAELLSSLFLKMDHINLGGHKYPVNTKNIEQRKIEASFSNELYKYNFQTLWMALNQQNYKEYVTLIPEKKKIKLNQVLRNNILSFYKGIDIWLDDKIMTKGSFQEKETKFKENKMLAFSGSFVTNALLPEGIGLGKSVSRGFGAINRS